MSSFFGERHIFFYLRILYIYPLIGYELSIDNSRREKEFLNSFSGLEKDKKDKGKNTKN